MNRLIFLICSVAISSVAFFQEGATAEAVVVGSAHYEENKSYLFENEEVDEIIVSSILDQFMEGVSANCKPFFKNLGFVSFDAIPRCFASNTPHPIENEESSTSFIFGEFRKNTPIDFDLLIEQLGFVSFVPHQGNAPDADYREGVISSFFGEFRENIAINFDQLFKKLGFVSFGSYKGGSEAVVPYLDFSGPIVGYSTDQEEGNREGVIFSIFGQAIENMSIDFSPLFKKLGFVSFVPYQGRAVAVVPDSISSMPNTGRTNPSNGKNEEGVISTFFGEFRDIMPIQFLLLFKKLGFISFVAEEIGNGVSQAKSAPWHSVGVVGLPSIGLLHHIQKQEPRRVNPYPIPKRIDFAHLEGEGIGYRKGYSKLGTIIGPEYQVGHFLPLLDLRGIVFDNGEFAANVGLVGRFLRKKACQIIGFNLFYDFREKPWGNFNQLGGGFEVLSKRWEVHLNSYFPISIKKHQKKCVFDDYIGDYRAERKEFQWGSYYGLDADFGYYVVNLHNFQLYAAAGPYFFSPRCGSGVFGVQAMLRPQVADYLSVELSVTHDEIYETNYQINVIFTIPLYNYSSVMKKKKGPCGMSSRQVYQPVERDEIIMLSRRCNWKFNWDSN